MKTSRNLFIGLLLLLLLLLFPFLQQISLAFVLFLLSCSKERTVLVVSVLSFSAFSIPPLSLSPSLTLSHTLSVGCFFAPRSVGFLYPVASPSLFLYLQPAT